jgi:hypothetical protein
MRCFLLTDLIACEYNKAGTPKCTVQTNSIKSEMNLVILSLFIYFVLYLFIFINSDCG